MAVMRTGESKCTSFATWTFVFPLIWLQEVDERSMVPWVGC